MAATHVTAQRATERENDEAPAPARPAASGSGPSGEASRGPADDGPSGPPDAPAYELIELFFFAYRDFVGDPDRILAGYAFGRAHHRVLHFVSRNPGLTIAELLEILKITKQSLNRVLKELIETGYVESRPGVADRRQRLLFASEAGSELAARLAGLQSRRVARALEGAPPHAREAVLDFLLRMIDPDERAGAAALTRGRPARGR